MDPSLRAPSRIISSAKALGILFSYWNFEDFIFQRLQSLKATNLQGSSLILINKLNNNNNNNNVSKYVQI